MKAIVLHLRLVRGMHAVPLAYEVRQHVKVMYITLGYSAYLNLDEVMIARMQFQTLR